jgi:hypothetical protein
MHDTGINCDEIVNSALRPASVQGNVSEAVRKLQRRQGDPDSLRLFNGIKLSDNEAEKLIRDIVAGENNRVVGELAISGPFKGQEGIAIFDASGRGILVDEATNTFITFLEEARGFTNIFK